MCNYASRLTHIEMKQMKDQLLTEDPGSQGRRGRLLASAMSGCPLAVAFAEHGFPVVGIDVDPRKVDALAARRILRAGHSFRAPGGHPARRSPRRPITPRSPTATRRSSACPPR